MTSPSTAEFPRYYQLDDNSITQSGRVYTIDAYVDAENAYGGTVRQNFSIQIEYDGYDNWNLIDLKFE